MTEPLDNAALELVNAYLDGELDQAAKLAFEERLAREPNLREMVERMRAVDSDLTTAFGAQPQTPPGDALLAAVKSFAAAQTAEPAPQTGKVIAFETRRSAPNPAESQSWRMPIAAALALFAGAGAMWLIQSGPGDSSRMPVVALNEGVVAERSALHAALEQTESGGVFTAGDDKVRPILSFAAKDGRFCREFETFGGSGSVVGVACKDDRGWKMEVLLSAAPHQPGETQYAPASGFNAKALDDVVVQLMDGQALSAEAEAAVRAKAWRKGDARAP